MTILILLYVNRERYPLTSQLIQENKIPEFGALWPRSKLRRTIDPSLR